MLLYYIYFKGAIIIEIDGNLIIKRWKLVGRISILTVTAGYYVAATHYQLLTSFAASLAKKNLVLYPLPS